MASLVPVLEHVRTTALDKGMSGSPIYPNLFNVQHIFSPTQILYIAAEVEDYHFNDVEGWCR